MNAEFKNFQKCGVSDRGLWCVRLRDSPAGARRGGVAGEPAALAGRPGAPGRWRSALHVDAHHIAV